MNTLNIIIAAVAFVGLRIAITPLKPQRALIALAFLLLMLHFSKKSFYNEAVTNIMNNKAKVVFTVDSEGVYDAKYVKK